MYAVRFLIAVVCFVAAGAGIYGLGRLAGCGDDNRERLVARTEGGTQWLRHPLGFQLLRPGAEFVEDRRFAEKLEGALVTTCDAYTSPADVLAVCTIDGIGGTREQFIGQIKAIRQDIAKVGLARARRAPGYLTSGLEGLVGATTVTDDVGWEAGHGTAYLHVLAKDLHVRVKAFTLGTTLVLLLATGEALGPSIDSFVAP